MKDVGLGSHNFRKRFLVPGVSVFTNSGAKRCLNFEPGDGIHSPYIAPYKAYIIPI